MQISSKGLAFIAGWEAFRPAPYYDEAGFPTVGYGHLLSHVKQAPLDMWQSVTQTQAINMLHADLAYFEEQLTMDIAQTPRLLPTTQEEFDAMTSLLFNIGWEWWVTSTIRRMHFNNAGATQIESAFSMFNMVPGSDGMLVESIGLTRRRKAEANVYNLLTYVTSDGTVL